VESEALPEVAVAIDELQRIERIVDRLLLLAKADQPDFLVADEVDLEPFLEDVFMRWSEVAPRVWRLGALAPVRLCADAEALRVALDALVENAVKYTGPEDAIEIRSLVRDGEVVIEVSDEGCGIPAAALDLIFDRFGRADAARSRAHGGAGLGLSIVDAIAKAHGGRCTVRADGSGAGFSLHLPAVRTVAERGAGAVEPVTDRLQAPAPV
jgi:signal transduction histidine kinase